MGAVKEFARAALGPLGSSSRTVETYVEVPFMLTTPMSGDAW
jgi:hypothetical protein